MGPIKILILSERQLRPDHFTGKIIWTENHYCYAGDIDYWLNGNLHSRTDGPAIFRKVNNGNPHGVEIKEYFYFGMKYSKEEWFHQLSEEDKLQALFNINDDIE